MFIVLWFKNREMKKNLKKIKELKSLEDGWDGVDAEPIPSHVINLAEQLTRSLTTQPEIFITGRKTIQMEFAESEKMEYSILIEIFDSSLITIRKGLESIKKEVHNHTDIKVISRLIKEAITDKR